METVLTKPRVLLLLVGLLSCQLGCGASEPTAAPATPTAGPVAESSVQPPADPPQPQVTEPTPAHNASHGETTVRTLATRNPFRPPTVEVRHLTSQQAGTADIRLLGFAQKESQRYALLVKEGAIRRVQPGDTLGAWEVREVGTADVRLRRGREEIVLQID